MYTPSANRGTFHIEVTGRRPWITVYDSQGFPDAWINPYLTFLAWQGATPGQVRRQARHLVAATQWLDIWASTWAGQSLEDWGLYYHLEGSETTFRTLHTHLETLYHFYGFWHWYDPRRMAVQPFPSARRERVAWLDRVLVDGEAGLPPSLPW